MSSFQDLAAGQISAAPLQQDVQIGFADQCEILGDSRRGRVGNNSENAVEDGARLRMHSRNVVLIDPFALFGEVRIIDHAAIMPISFALAPPPGTYMGSWSEFSQSLWHLSSKRTVGQHLATVLVATLDRGGSPHALTTLEIHPIGDSPLPQGEIAVNFLGWIRQDALTCDAMGVVLEGQTAN